MKIPITHMPTDEESLVEFLRQYRPIAPPPAPDLEAQILKAVESLPVRESSPFWVRLARRPLWLVPASVAAGLLLSANFARLLMPQSPSAAEMASLESFLATNWDGVVNGSSLPDSSSDWLSPVYSPTEQNGKTKVRN